MSLLVIDVIWNLVKTLLEFENLIILLLSWLGGIHYRVIKQQQKRHYTEEKWNETENIYNTDIGGSEFFQRVQRKKCTTEQTKQSNNEHGRISPDLEMAWQDRTSNKSQSPADRKLGKIMSMRSVLLLVASLLKRGLRLHFPRWGIYLLDKSLCLRCCKEVWAYIQRMREHAWRTAPSTRHSFPVRWIRISLSRPNIVARRHIATCCVLLEHVYQNHCRSVEIGYFQSHR